MEHRSLARGAARGATWNLVTVVAERAFGFVILGIMLRYVPAASVGIVAIGSAISDVARLIAVGGSIEQVQAYPGDKQVEAGAFWSQFLACLVFMAGLLAAAPWLGRAYGAPILTFIVQMMALNVLMTSFLVVPAARLMQDFRFPALGLMSVGSTVAGGLAALPFAFAGHGIDALIYQRMVGVGFYALVSCAVTRWVPPRLPGWAVLRRSFRFSLPLMQAAMVDYISMTGYVMLVGLRMPLAAVGQFRIAQRLIEVLQEIAFLPARKVFMPVFVAVREDAARRFEITVQMLDVLSMAMFFLAAVAGSAASPLVILMFGAKWAAAGPVFAVLTLMAPVTALYGLINPLLTAVGRTQLVSVFSIANALLIVAAVWFAAPYGLEALAWALAGRGLLSVLLFVPALKIGLDRPVMPLLRLLILPGAALMTARGAAMLALWQLPNLVLYQRFFTGGGVAAAVFLLVVALAAPGRLRAMAGRVRAALLGRRVQAV